jgi:hypothetical protein
MIQVRVNEDRFGSLILTRLDNDDNRYMQFQSKIEEFADNHPEIMFNNNGTLEVNDNIVIEMDEEEFENIVNMPTQFRKGK